MEDRVPYSTFAVVAWIVLSLVAAIIARKPVIAFLLGLMVSAAFIGYCMYYDGFVESGGILQALSGGATVLGLFYFFRRVRRRPLDTPKMNP